MFLTHQTSKQTTIRLMSSVDAPLKFRIAGGSRDTCPAPGFTDGETEAWLTPSAHIQGL